MILNLFQKKMTPKTINFEQLPTQGNILKAVSGREL
jgi:hypothetical protein